MTIAATPVYLAVGDHLQPRAQATQANAGTHGASTDGSFLKATLHRAGAA